MATIHPTAEEQIIDRLQHHGPCTIDDVAKFLHPTHSRSAMFDAIDHLIGDGRLALREVGYSIYQIVLLSPPLSPRSPSRMKEARP